MNPLTERHLCKGDLPAAGYGPAIHACREDAYGKLWIDNGEYFSQVNFCPYCGVKAETAVRQ